MNLFAPHSGNPQDSLLYVWFDSRHISALVNSLIVGALTALSLALLATLFTIAFYVTHLTGNRAIYITSLVPLLIPDQVFGIAGRALLDPSFGILKGLVPSGIIIGRFEALGMISVAACLKWLPAMAVVADSAILSLGAETLSQARMDFHSLRESMHLVLLPQLRATLLMICSLCCRIGLRQHEMADELTSSGGGLSAELWSLWNYKEMFEFARMSRAAAEAILALFFLLIPIMVIQRLVRTDDER